MKIKIILIILALSASINILACTTIADYEISAVRFPVSQIENDSLSSYIIAYCWRPEYARVTVDEPEQKEVYVVVQNGNGVNKSVTDEYPTSSPAFVNMIGCFSNNTLQDLRLESGKIHWRPNTDEIGLVYGTSKNTSWFKMLSIQESSLTIIDKGDLVGLNEYFWHQEDVFWSPDGSKFATRAFDLDLGHSIWVYEIDSRKITQLINIEKVGNFVENASWSSAGDKIAIGYGVPHSGIAIVAYDKPESYIEITSSTTSILRDWRYSISSPLKALEVILTNPPVYSFNFYISNRSLPVWINNDEQIIFVAANKQQKATFFIVNSDGSELKELLPELPGIVGLPTLSPDQKTLAFIRYPNWKNNDRAEIATLNIETLEIKSLAVFPAPENGDELWISGLSWTPDGEYLAVSSPHTGESEIYVISKDGSAWLNLTEDMEGDAVSPAWKP